MLADLNLQVAAVHFPVRRGFGSMDDLDRRIDAIKKAMKMAYELGCNVVVSKIGSVPEDSEDASWSTMLQALTDLGNYSQKSGAWLAARTGAEKGEVMKRLIDSLPANSLGVDFDPAGFVINGLSAPDAIKVLGEHVLSFRVRDAVSDLSLGRGVEVQLGRGSVDWPALLGVLEEHSYNGYLTVERNTDKDNVVQCATALEFLTNLFQ